MSLYDSAIKYAMKILNHEPNYSLDRLRKISEMAYVVAKRYIDDINSSKKNVQTVINTGLIRNINISFITAQANGWNLINGAIKNVNLNAFLKGAHVIATSEEEYCNKLAPYIRGLTRLNLEINQIKLKMDSADAELSRLAKANDYEAFKTKLKETESLQSELSNLRKQRFDLIKEFLERNNIR